MSLLSNRQARKAMGVAMTTQVEVNRLLIAFLTRGLFGRLKWLLLGI